MSTYPPGAWTPKDRGAGVYCSDACGFKCTREAYDRAHVEAGELAKRLGDGWEPRVWENGGWHYEAVKGVVCVKPTVGREGAILSYTAYVNTKHGVQKIAGADTPEEALGHAMQDARTSLHRWEAELNEVSA